MDRPLRLLTFSTLYPNAVNPRHGIFVANRLTQLLRSGGVEARVVAPIPWFPFTHARFGNWARYAQIPHTAEERGITTDHPRYPLLPKIGMTLAPLAMALAVFPKLKRQIMAGQDFDLIDAHYYYPDGVAAMLLGLWLNKPVVITARGSDLTLLPRYTWPRHMIRWAARRCAASITVCQALKRELIALGVPASRITVLRNGVDLAQFYPRPRETLRTQLGVQGPILLSVGNLIPLKGNHLTLTALADLPLWHLVLAGEGPERRTLQSLAQRLGVADRVHFLGHVSNAELPHCYSGADAMVLASSREGWANVLLESMACGTPVIATDVGGTAEVVASPAAGILLAERSAQAIHAGVLALMEAPPDRNATRRYAEAFSWDATSDGQKCLFSAILSDPKR